jgi:uncharacterized protein with GYD domain
MEAFYYAFGEDDIYVIFDASDNVAAAASSMTVNSAGVARVYTVVLVTPEEMDEVSKKRAEYTPPGA